MRKAAQALGITQSSFTTQIIRLERDLGQPLLERAERGRPMQLPPVGSLVADAACKIFRAASELGRRC